MGGNPGESAAGPRTQVLPWLPELTPVLRLEVSDWTGKRPTSSRRPGSQPLLTLVMQNRASRKVPKVTPNVKSFRCRFRTWKSSARPVMTASMPPIWRGPGRNEGRSRPGLRPAAHAPGRLPPPSLEICPASALFSSKLRNHGAGRQGAGEGGTPSSPNQQALVSGPTRPAGARG